MSPAEHYLEAERLLRSLTGLGPNAYAEHAPTTIAAAQVHATLAAAGATLFAALPGYDTARHKLADAMTPAATP